MATTEPSPAPIIDVRGLRKSYGSKTVLDGIDLSVTEGEILGILGPNGSGKTTAVECIGGLRQPDAGTIRVAGLDPSTNPPELRDLLGMQLQQCRLPGRMTAREALELYGAFYLDAQPADDLLERFDLTEQADQRFENLSGGQQQRLSVALALVGRPHVAFLDELTTGLDPGARRDIWSYLRQLRDEGTTMVLVTHFMDEAQYLCDRVVVLDGGHIVAEGSPADVAGAAGGQETSFTSDPTITEAWLRSLPGVTEVRTERGRTHVRGDADSPQTLLMALAKEGFTPHELRVESPSLDDAFLRLTQESAR